MTSSEPKLISCRAVELIRREIMRLRPDTVGVHAVLIDFLLYDLAKEREDPGKCTRSMAFWPSRPPSLFTSAASRESRPDHVVGLATVSGLIRDRS